ncbi:hypothetical protein P692DRAFT_20838365 [Suillus brevipes Sb2]|nr:hypothetical protein P692DRAFT_20838365 [Suillus brevipes Sb2]
MRFSFAVILTALAACASVSACSSSQQRCYPNNSNCCPGLKCACYANSLKITGTVFRLPTGGLAASR